MTPNIPHTSSCRWFPDHARKSQNFQMPLPNWCVKEVARQPGEFGRVGNEVFLLESKERSQIAIAVFTVGNSINEMAKDELDNWDIDLKFANNPQLVMR